MTRKTIYFAIAILFAVFAILQYNDPDPFLWILIYLSVSIVAVLKVYLRQLNFRPLTTTLIVILVLFSLTYIPGVIDYLSKPNKQALFGSMSYKTPWVEETREFLGLLIAVGALFYLRKPLPKTPKKKKK